MTGLSLKESAQLRGPIVPGAISAQQSWDFLASASPDAESAGLRLADDLRVAIREFADSIAFVHFRDLPGNADGLNKTVHDGGQTDFAACMFTYQGFGFSRTIRPDHVPIIEAEPHDPPGHGVPGRLSSLRNTGGLRHPTYGHSAALEHRR